MRRSSLLPGVWPGMVILFCRGKHSCWCLHGEDAGAEVPLSNPPSSPGSCQHGLAALLKVLLVPGTDPGLLPLPNCQVAHKPE